MSSRRRGRQLRQQHGRAPPGPVRARGAVRIPGVATPTEAFAALAAGADALKLFPAEMVAAAVLKALRAVLPRDAKLLPAGGITLPSLVACAAAGAPGCGPRSALYREGDVPVRAAAQAQVFVQAWLEVGGGGLKPQLRSAPARAGSAPADR